MRRAAPANIAQADYFLYHRDNNSTALRINVPAEQRQATQNTIEFTRRLDGPDDSFAGVVILWLFATGVF